MRVQKRIEELVHGDIVELLDGTRKHVASVALPPAKYPNDHVVVNFIPNDYTSAPAGTLVTVVGRNSVELLPNGRFRLYGEPVVGVTD